MDINDPHINLVFARAIVDGEAVNEVRVNWIIDYSKPYDHEDNMRPDWADLPVDERLMWVLPDTLVNAITRRTLQQPNRFVQELPCPPYMFDMDDGRLRIKAGPFEKHGSKAEWTAVIEQMQRQVDDMPDGINVEHASDITVEIDITGSTSVDVSVDTLLYDHPNYDDGLWTGDEHDLESALEEAIDEYDFSQAVEMDYVETEMEVTGHDVDYLMRNL